MIRPDLSPAARRLAALVAAVPDDVLDAPTPCPAYTVGDLLDHIGGLAVAFTAAASRAGAPVGSQGPSGDAARLGDGWRTRIPEALAALASAWRDPAAWTGLTQAGGVDLPGEVAGVVALDEVIIHGWDLARATGQAYECSEPMLEVVRPFLAQAAESPTGGPFGPPVPVPDGAPLLDRVIGLSGRDPGWSSPG